jgi:hypothetical protein
VHRCFQDALLTSPSVSGLRAAGVVTGDTKKVILLFGESESALKREVKVEHRKFQNGGEWSFFVCPTCDRRARLLKLYDGRPMCWRCCQACGVRYRSAGGSPVERADTRVKRIENLRARLEGGPARLHPRPGRTLDRRGALEMSLRRAQIASRQDLLCQFSAKRGMSAKRGQVQQR